MAPKKEATKAAPVEKTTAEKTVAAKPAKAAAAKAGKLAANANKPRLQQEYESTIKAKMQETFSYKKDMQVTKLEKIVINM